MANNDLPIRFTETNYCTKSDVARELKMTIIDNIWTNILTYRFNFNRYLTIKSIANNQMVFCGCSAINSMVNSANGKLLRANRSYGKLNNNNGQLAYFEENTYRNILLEISKYQKVYVSEDRLKQICSGKAVTDFENTEDATIIRYYNALTYVKEAYVNPINDNFLAALFSKITGNDEITKFYRTVEDTSNRNQYQIGRVYTCAPVAKIEPMMNGFFTFLEKSSIDPVVKAISTLFYINYIKPFSTYNYELSILLSKAVLAHEIMDESAVFLCYEDAIGYLEFEKFSTEVQKTDDITYFINWFLKILDKKSDFLLDAISNASIQDVKKDFYRIDEPQVNSQPEPVKNVGNVTEEPKEEAVVLDEEKKPEPEKEPERKTFTYIPEPEVTNKVSVAEEKPVKMETVSLFDSFEDEKVAEQVAEKETSAPVKAMMPVEEVKTESSPNQVIYSQPVLAVSLPTELNEKEAKKLENDLLETDPNLRKGEAKFYARHCTIGKKYTIAQYKKELKCVYETARTSMEHLAKLGYYQKEQVKNKFVYAPIPRNK